MVAGRDARWCFPPGCRRRRMPAANPRTAGRDARPGRHRSSGKSRDCLYRDPRRSLSQHRSRRTLGAARLPRPQRPGLVDPRRPEEPADTLCRNLAGRGLSQRGRRRQLAAAPRPADAGSSQDAIRLPDHAFGQGRRPSGRDLCGARGQRRHAQPGRWRAGRIAAKT
jgi:hypothetical protein